MANGHFLTDGFFNHVLAQPERAGLAPFPVDHQTLFMTNHGCGPVIAHFFTLRITRVLSGNAVLYCHPDLLKECVPEIISRVMFRPTV